MHLGSALGPALLGSASMQQQQGQWGGKQVRHSRDFGGFWSLWTGSDESEHLGNNAKRVLTNESG
jgi:hypothetical protein